MLWALDYSLTFNGYEMLSIWMGGFWFKALLWLLLIPYLYHTVAGIRHLLSDLHLGNTRVGGKTSSLIVFGITAILILLAGIWIW